MTASIDGNNVVLRAETDVERMMLEQFSMQGARVTNVQRKMEGGVQAVTVTFEGTRNG